MLGGIFSYPLGMYLAAWVFLPVYFQCETTTVNEFLEMRYGPMIRYIMSGLFLVQMVFYMVTSLYGSVLALSAVTDLPIEISIVTLGIICTLYCAIGGLKAVLWTDVFQSILIMTCIISLYSASLYDAGSISQIYHNTKEGGRQNFLDFDPDMTKRYTFWNSNIRSLVFGFGFYGTNQMEVQRILSMSTIQRAKSSLRLSIFPGLITFVSCNILGLILYSVFYLCDPILNTEQAGPSRYDQLVPWYIIRMFSSIPGMTGLCMAGIFSAALSSISSALNSASTVTVVDFIKPFYMKQNISDFKIVLLAKILSIMYGGICISLTFCFMDVQSISQLGSTMISALEGPTFAVFLVGVLTRKASDKNVSFSLILGWLIMIWISFGSLFTKQNFHPLPLSTSRCPAKNYTVDPDIYSSPMCTLGYNCTTTNSPSSSTTEESFILHRIAYNWHAPMGFILTLVLIFLTVLVTGWNRNIIPEDSKCLSPVTRFWMKKTNQNVVITGEGGIFMNQIKL